MTAPQLAGRLSIEALRGRLFVGVPEAAQLLELDPRTLRRAIDAGDFPAVRVAGPVGVPVARLLALAGLGDDPADQSAAGAAPAILDGAHHGPRLAS